MRPRLEIDDARRRILVTSGFDVMSRELIGAVVEAAVQAPERADHDFIIDVRESYGDGSHEDIVKAAEAFRALGAGRRAARTCIVSLDEGFVHWARAMDFCFLNRTHHVFLHPEAAHAFLDRDEGTEPSTEAA